MAERTPGESAEEQLVEPSQEGLGFSQLSMNEIPAATTGEDSEAPRRASRLALVLLIVLVAAGAVFIGGKLITNMAPGREADARLRKIVSALPAWQKGIVMDVRYVAGDRVRLAFSARASTETEAGRDAIRDATRVVMDAVIEERSDRNLYVDGYKGEEQIVRAEYRAKPRSGPSGEQIRDIVVRVAGDTGGGIGEAYELRPTPGGGM